MFCQLRERHAQLISVAVTREDRQRTDVAGATDITWRLRFFVLDRRFGGIPRAGHLDAACFCAYARHVLAHDGKPSWRDRVLDCLIGDPDRLMYRPVA
ncbi:hypothetical protein D3C72_2284550 [compost metagenome]